MRIIVIILATLALVGCSDWSRYDECIEKYTGTIYHPEGTCKHLIP